MPLSELDLRNACGVNAEERGDILVNIAALNHALDNRSILRIRGFQPRRYIRMATHVMPHMSLVIQLTQPRFWLLVGMGSIPLP